LQLAIPSVFFFHRTPESQVYTPTLKTTISILGSQLNDIDAYASGEAGDVEKITEFFKDNLDRLNASGATLDDEVDILFKGLKAVPCKEFRSYIN
jgi:hypothetical protein